MTSGDRPVRFSPRAHAALRPSGPSSLSTVARTISNSLRESCGSACCTSWRAVRRERFMLASPVRSARRAADLPAQARRRPSMRATHPGQTRPCAREVERGEVSRRASCTHEEFAG
jgi:hypothetical protein